MVRFALLFGAGVFIALLSLSATSQFRGTTEDLVYEQDTSSAPTATTTVAEQVLVTDDRLAELPETESLKEDQVIPMKKSTSSREVVTNPPLLQPVIETPRLPSLPPENLNEKARLALVNILCEASAPLRSTSGSGVMIDSRGIILTNAHIAQNFLLENSSFPVSCTVRAGSPAKAVWHAKLIFIPEKWVEKHAKDVLASRATGTGEHDYAFLMITDTIDGSSLPLSFASIPLNGEEAAIVTGDPVLVAGYPAEFIGGGAARNSLYASTVFSSVKQLLTFTEGVVDVVSVGGTVLAQSGSSGGSFIDLYGHLVGLIVTTSFGDTTGERDLHAITPAHIDRSLRQHVGHSTRSFLSQESSALLTAFDTTAAELSGVLQGAIKSQRE